MNADLDAISAYCSIFENIGMAEFLPKVGIPCLFYAGEDDVGYYSASKACAEIVPGSEFVSFPGLNHIGASSGSKTVLPHVLRFLEKHY